VTVSRDTRVNFALTFGLAGIGVVLGLVIPVMCRSRPSEQPVKAPSDQLAGEALEGAGGYLYRLAGYGPVMGSDVSLSAVFPNQRDPRAKAAFEKALAAALGLEKRITKYEPESEVRRAWGLAPGQSFQVSEDTFRAIELSKELWSRSGGAFDCTVQPLIELYKYTGKEERPPTDRELAEARARVGSEALILDREKRTVAFAAAGMKIDLGAVGQGLGTDLACGALREAGATSALVELGGEVRAFGRKLPGKPWSVAIVHPRAPGRTMATVELDGNAVSTSGDYQKFFKSGGRRASHLLDPRTGKPLVGGAVSVTIIAPECILADGLATAVSVLGPAEGLKLVESYRAEGGRAEGKTVEALIIEETADGKLVPHFSPGLAGKLKVELEVPGAAPAK